MIVRNTAVLGACIALAACGDTPNEPDSASSRKPSTSECVERWNQPGNEQATMLAKTWKRSKLSPDRRRIWIGPSQVDPTLCAAVFDRDPHQNYSIVRENEESATWHHAPLPEEFTHEETIQRRENANVEGLDSGKFRAP